MSEPNSPDNRERDETLDKFPELARGRDLYINLFKDDSPLVNLGYTASQKRLAKDSLWLLEGPGTVINPERPEITELGFEEEGKWLTINEFRGGNGYELVAVNEPKHSRDIIGFLSSITEEKSNGVFEWGYVAFIKLVKTGTYENSLDSLVKTFYDKHFFEAENVERETPVSTISRKLGMNATYRAKWTDETTKLEFVVEIKTPKDKEIDGPFYQTWRRLSPIQDLKGKLVPFGRKPNSSKDKVLETLNAQPEKAVQGQFAWQPR